MKIYPHGGGVLHANWFNRKDTYNFLYYPVEVWVPHKLGNEYQNIEGEDDAIEKELRVFTFAGTLAQACWAMVRHIRRRWKRKVMVDEEIKTAMDDSIYLDESKHPVQEYMP